MALLAVLLAPTADAAVGPGCDPARAAVAHHAGGRLARPQPAAAPIPCGMQTGFVGGESAIAVTNSGAVLYAPAVQTFAGTQAQHFLGGNSGFAETTDLGRTWRLVLPISPNLAVPANPLGKPGWPAWDQIDDKFFMDRTHSHRGRCSSAGSSTIRPRRRSTAAARVPATGSAWTT